MAAVFATLVTTLPTSTAVLIAERAGKPKTHLWRAPAVTAQWAKAATVHAQATYGYFADCDPLQMRELARGQASLYALPASEGGDPEEGYVIFPLVIDRDRIFGALQIQGAAGLDQTDLTFIGAVANELALALYRQGIHDRTEALLVAARTEVDRRDETLAFASHDLGNLLTPILLEAQLGFRAEPAGDSHRERFAKISSAAGKMKRLIKDLLDADGIEAGHLSVDIRTQAVPQLVADGLESMRPLAHDKSLTIQCDIRDEYLPVRADHGRVLQVFANLLSNAIKFTPEGGTISVSAKSAGDTVRFTVRDTGPGISPADLPHVFSRYWQAKGNPKLGRGLGLFIARGIIETLGGQIWAETREGASFSFTLPTATDPITT